MRDIGGNCGQDGGPATAYLGLALEVIDRLARRLGGVGELDADVVDRIVALATTAGPRAGSDILDLLNVERIGCDKAADLYIPEAARAMGQAWMDDRLSFVQVTVGAARLQDLLHRIGAEQRADANNSASESAVLVVVPPGEQHTLGALVVTMALRRRGVSVNLQIAPAITDLGRIVSAHRFDGALVSVATTQGIESAAKLVKTLKYLTKGRLRVAVGGATCMDEQAALSLTGADLITNDTEVVISGFGLQEHRTGANG